MSAMDFVNGGVNTYLNAFDSMRQHWAQEAEERAAMIDEHNRRVDAHNEYVREVNYQNRLAKLKQFAVEMYDSMDERQTMIVDLQVSIKRNEIIKSTKEEVYGKFFSESALLLNKLQHLAFKTDCANAVLKALTSGVDIALEDQIGKDKAKAILDGFMNLETIVQLKKDFGEIFLKGEKVPSCNEFADPDLARKLQKSESEIKSGDISDVHKNNIRKLKNQFNSVFDFHYDHQADKMYGHCQDLVSYDKQLSQIIINMIRSEKLWLDIIDNHEKSAEAYIDVLVSCLKKTVQHLYDVQYEAYQYNEFLKYLTPHVEQHIYPDNPVFAKFSADNLEVIRNNYLTEKLKNGDPRIGVPSRFNFEHFIIPDDDISKAAKDIAASLQNSPVG